MTKDAPLLDEWRKLYEAAIEIKKIAPWEWMEEMDIFGVQNPETGELGFVSIMGTLGEHLAISVYSGAKGLYGFWDLENAGPDEMPERLLEIPQLQASFEGRNELQKKDRDLINQLGLKFRGRQAWPLFRSFRPGFVPWFLEGVEARFLTHVLEQTHNVALRYKEDVSLLEPPDDETYLVRVPHADNGTITWVDKIRRIPPPEPTAISLAMDVQALERLKHLPKQRVTLEADFFLAPMPVQENRDERPYYPYILMIVETHSGAIVGHEMFSLESSLEDMWGQVPARAVQQMAAAGIVPNTIKVRSRLLFQLLQPIAQEVRFKLKQSDYLSSLDPAKEMMFQWFR